MLIRTGFSLHRKQKRNALICQGIPPPAGFATGSRCPPPPRPRRDGPAV